MDKSTEKQKEYQVKLINGLLVIVAIAVLIYAATLIKSYKTIGAFQKSTIMVQGTGKVQAKPDTAKITISIRETAKTAKDAQTAVSKKWDDAKVKLLALGVEEKNIKNTSYTTYPKYSYTQSMCTNGYCPAGKQVLDGYEVSQTVEIKSKNVDDTGKLLEALAAAGVVEVSGPEMVIDDIDAIKSEARKMAIDDAKEKAKELAKQLNIDLGDIIYFNDDSASVNIPYADYGMSVKNMSARAEMAPVIPDVPVGENEISSNVSITYEID